MAVAYDSVGPSSAGAGNITGAALSWTHTTVAASTVLAVFAALGNSPDSAFTLAATCDSTSMAAGPVVHTNAGTAGFLKLFTVTGLAAGVHTIVVTPSGGTAGSVAGGSIAASGAVTFGTPVSGTGSSTSALATMAANTSGNLILAGIADGSSGESVTGTGTSRFIIDEAFSSGAGCAAGQTAPATGSSVSITWTISSDFWAVIAVEAQAGVAAGTGNAVRATGAGAAQPATTIPSSLLSGPNYAGSAADLGGGYGAWLTPAYAEGGP